MFGRMTSAFDIADRLVDELCDLDPLLATSIGVTGHDHEWGDLGMAGVEARHDLLARYAHQMRGADEEEPAQRLAARVTLGSIDEEEASYAAGDHFRDLRHLGCTFHRLRSVFDLMPSKGAEDWDNIAIRLETIDKAYAGYEQRLAEGLGRGVAVARRQAESIAAQAASLAGEHTSYHALLDDATKAHQMSDRLDDAARHARSAAAHFASWLRTSYLPAARDHDAVGEEQYRRSADRLVGMSVDPDEAYAWGWEEFFRLRGEMRTTGERVIPAAGFAEIKEHLETDAEGLARSTDELVEFVEDLLANAVESLAGTHFEVPDAIKPLTVQIAPPGGPLGVYYMGPSEDFSRPGGVWYSIGDQTEFPLYQHVSTAYHEGFPGHHLQIATTRYRKEDLSRAQRLLTWYPGYGEGWAMYAEVLMGELGYLSNPKHYFGMLAKQMYRAARVVVDIGLHLDKRIPDHSPLGSGQRWDFATAAQFMETYGFRTSAQAEAEVLRYLGWPGQAIAYKLGQREILSIREEARASLGAGFDLKEFHATVLNHGAMRLDLLRDLVGERVV